jgi:hypothetical protein
MTICGKQGLYTLRTSVKHGAPRPAAAARSRGRAPRPHAADGTVGGLSAPESRPGLNKLEHVHEQSSRRLAKSPCCGVDGAGAHLPRDSHAGAIAHRHSWRHSWRVRRAEPMSIPLSNAGRFLQFLITVIRGPRMLPQWRTKAGHQFLIYMMANVDECQGLFLVY